MKIATDKRLHILAGAAMAVAVAGLHLIAQAFGLHWAALAGGAGVSIGYELLQKYRGEGEPSLADAAAGIAGSAAAAAVLWWWL